MENSKAYRYLMSQINAVGSKRLDGYYAKIMEEIYDWEREEVEEIIWKTFHENRDMDLAIFLPKLQKYDGIDALKAALGKCLIPSSNSVIISQVLYEHTENDRYLDVIKENIDKDKDSISNVATLAYCKPCKKAYDFLVDIYIKSDDKTIRSTAVTGILFNKGIIMNPHNLQEVIKNVELERKFIADDENERKRIITVFEEGKL